MRRIIKDDTPDFWAAYVRRHPTGRYCELDSTLEGRALRKQLRSHLVKQQEMICCYCCGSLKGDASNAHNEHVKPQSSYPNDSMDYGNLLASCNEPNTCGSAKEGLYDALMFVSPLQEDCEEHFAFLEDGRIKGVTEKGSHTIKALNLNHGPLVERRKVLLNECFAMARCLGEDHVRQEYLQARDDKPPRYVDMVSYFFRKGSFDLGV